MKYIESHYPSWIALCQIAKSLFQLFLGQISNHILSCFEGVSSVTDAKSAILRELTVESCKFNIFNGLESQNMQLAYFKECLNFIVSY